MLLAALGLLSVAGPAQQQPDGPPDLAALARSLRTGRPGDAELRAAGATMLSAGEAGARSLFNVVRPELASRGRDFRRDLQRLLRDYGRAAPAVLARRLGREGPARVEQLRGEIVARSRRDGLEKATIRDEIDPRLADLRGLLTLTPAEVDAAVPRLGAEVGRLRREAGTLEVLFELQERAELELLRSETGRRHVERHALADDPRGYAGELERRLAQACRLAMPIGERDARVLDANGALADGVDAEERRGVEALNEIRALVGLPVLAIDVRLCAASRDHSRDMAELGFFSHASPVAGKETFGQRAARAGTSASAENIARGQGTGAGAIEAWWYSPGHHRNMMSGATRVGLGRHGDHWTQMLGG